MFKVKNKKTGEIFILKTIEEVEELTNKLNVDYEVELIEEEKW